MKGKEIAKYLLEKPDWDVEFYFFQHPDEIECAYIRTFTVVDIADSAERKVTVLIGREDG